MAGPDPAILFARLQLSFPEARSFLFATVDEGRSIGPIAAGVAATMHDMGLDLRWIDVTLQRTESKPPAGVKPLALDGSLFANVNRLRAALTPAGGYQVIAGGSLLHDAHSLVLSGVADAVVIGSWRGVTSRDALEQVRADIERAGGKIAGAILLG